MKKSFFTVVLLCFASVCGYAQVTTMCKSYGQTFAQGYAAGQVASVQQGNGIAAICIWTGENKIVNCNGNYYRYQGADVWGNLHYRYFRTDEATKYMSLMGGMLRPVELIFTPDWGKMRDNYQFGIQGAYVPMSAEYWYLGEGTEPALEYQQEHGVGNNGWM